MIFELEGPHFPQRKLQAMMARENLTEFLLSTDKKLPSRKMG